MTSQGFCLLNNVAIGAAYARYNYKTLLKYAYEPIMKNIEK